MKKQELKTKDVDTIGFANAERIKTSERYFNVAVFGVGIALAGLIGFAKNYCKGRDEFEIVDKNDKAKQTLEDWYDDFKNSTK